MSFLEDLTFAQALILIAVVWFAATYARSWVKGDSLHQRVTKLEFEVKRLADQAGSADSADEP